MNRREAIATALASMALPRAVLAESSGPITAWQHTGHGYHRFVNGVCKCGQKSTDDPDMCAVFGPRVYSLDAGDHGRVWLNDKQVKAVACCLGEGQEGSGWVECFIDEHGQPLGIDDQPVIVGGEPAKARILGRVRFEPTE